MMADDNGNPFIDLEIMFMVGPIDKHAVLWQDIEVISSDT